VLHQDVTDKEPEAVAAVVLNVILNLAEMPSS
jgi:hypothetical protein